MKTGVLLMAHGSPDKLEEMGDYLRRVMMRRSPTPEFIAEITERYRQIGGRSPLLDITRKQAEALQGKLELPVYVGMRHWTPYIHDAVEQARRDGVERLIGLQLAPQYARVSVGAYHAELQKTGFPCVLVNNWHLDPSLIEYWKRATRGKEFVLFTAHSIPVEGAEPYPAQLAEMVRAIATGPHAFAYQSRSPSPIPWLGPEVPEVLRTLYEKLPSLRSALSAITSRCSMTSTSCIASRPGSWGSHGSVFRCPTPIRSSSRRSPRRCGNTSRFWG